MPESIQPLVLEWVWAIGIFFGSSVLIMSAAFGIYYMMKFAFFWRSAHIFTKMSKTLELIIQRNRLRDPVAAGVAASLLYTLDPDRITREYAELMEKAFEDSDLPFPPRVDTTVEAVKR